MANPNPEGDLVVAIPYDAESFNEVWRNYTGAGGYFVANNIFSRLVVIDVFESGDISPDLAESWESPDNGKTWIFHLNPNAKWEDGQPLTAHDVAYTFTECLKHRYHGTSWLQDIETATALDDHTLECVLQAPNAAFLAQLANFVFTHVVPKHLYEGTDWNENPHNWNPVGSGPFKFKNWVKGEKIELEANPDYWGEGPYVKTLTYVVVPDEEAGLEMVRTGKAHFFVQDVPCHEVASWAEEPDVNVTVDSGNALAFVAFNWTKPMFQDHRVREAFARAIDRAPIAAEVCPYATTPQHYYLESVDWAFNPDAKAPDYDPARAEELLDDAGYPRGENGERMHVRLARRSLYGHYGVAAEVMAEQLRAIGVGVTTESLDPVAWSEQIGKNADFDLALDSGDIGPDPQLMASFLTSDGPRNTMRYNNPAVDAAFRDGRASTDKAERGKHYRKLQDELAKDIARIPFMQHGSHMPYSTKFVGWSWDPGVRGTVPFWYHGKVRKA